MNNKKLIKKNKKGFTLLFAVLVSTLVLAVGASIISMALRQVILSGIGRDSQFAFYAANTGMDCGVYWDHHDSLNFATSNQSTYPATIPSNVKCAGQHISSITISDEGVDSATSEFNLEFNNVQGGSPISSSVPYCVDVFITKEIVQVTLSNGNTENKNQTTVSARGYNTCDTNNPRRIERGLQLKYID